MPCSCAIATISFWTARVAPRQFWYAGIVRFGILLPLLLLLLLLLLGYRILALLFLRDLLLRQVDGLLHLPDMGLANCCVPLRVAAL